MKSRGFSVLAGAVVVTVLANTVLGGHGEGYYGLGRRAGWLITIAVMIWLLTHVGSAVKGRADGVFIDDRNRISLSRFQLILWTILLVSALISAGLSNVAIGSLAPLEIEVPQEVWALLGIGAFSFVAAPALVDSRKKDGAPSEKVQEQVAETVTAEDALDGTKKLQLDNNVPAKEDADEARWMDLIRGDTTAGFAQIDVSKVQQLAFTILLVAVYAASLCSALRGGPDMKEIKEFPSIDGGFVALLGLSHAAYLTYKKTAT